MCKLCPWKGEMQKATNLGIGWTNKNGTETAEKQEAPKKNMKETVRAQGTLPILTLDKL